MRGTIALQLPWPPVTANQYWKVWRGRAVLNPLAKAYRQQIYHDFHTRAGFGDKRLAVVIYITPPNNRAFDIDNHAKIPIDTLEYAGWFENDSQIDQLFVARLPANKENPGLLVQISEVDARDGDTSDNEG